MLMIFLVCLFVCLLLFLHLSGVFVPGAAALVDLGESDGADDERDEAEDESESGDSHGAVDLVLGILVPPGRVPPPPTRTSSSLVTLNSFARLDNEALD